MLNTLRINSLRATGLKAALATLLLAAGPWAAAAPVTVDLCATSGTTAGSASITPAVPVYGYASGACSATALTGPGGPVISVMEGDDVTVNLQNSLAVPSGLVFVGQTMVPDTTGAPAAAAGVPGAKSYSFKASKAGTYLYQAAPIVSAEYQAAMGLYGALVVRPNVTFAATGVSIARTDAAAAVVTASAEVIDAAALATDVGSVVTGTGVPPGTTVSAVSAGVSFTMSNPATADGAGVVITRTDASATVTSASTTVTDTGILASDVGSLVTGGGILPGTTISSVTAAASFVMSQAAQPAAYDANTVVDEEAVLVLSELDPALNGSAIPGDFDMRSYAPKYFLINGKVFPDTAEIGSAANHKLLLRYVNAGAKHHSMGLLGLRQNFIAKDARLLPTSAVRVTAETLAPGQTGDALVTVPATAGKFALYDANLALHNNAGAGIGGMLTFVNATPGAASTGPTVANVAFAPAAVAGGSATLTADAGSATANVDAAEYFVDTKGADGTGTALAGTFGTPAVAISASVDASTLAHGKHTVYVHAHDSSGAWGNYNFAVLNVDKTGPTSSALLLSPNPSNGTGTVTLTASASDVGSGGSKVTAARYSIDAGATVVMDAGGAAAPVRSLSASFTSPSTGGAHTIAVEAQDELGNWGPPVSATLTVTTVGPTTTINSISPNPTNGIQGANSSSSVVRVTATMASSSAKISAAEAFIDTVGANGSGFPFVPSDGQFGAPTDTGTESGYGDIPLTTVAGLSAGNHNILVHGRDVAGNWGAIATGVLTVNKSAPTVSNVLLVPPYANNTAVQIIATASDAATGNNGIAGGEYFIDTVGAIGSGTAMSYSNGALRATISSVRISGLAPGVHTVYVRARDGVLPVANANWSATMGAALTIDRTRPTFLGITRNGTSPTNAASVSYTIRFSEPVTGVGQNDFQVIRNPAGNTNLQISGSGATRVVTITGYGNNFVGTVGLNVRNSATITDLAGNGWLASTQVGQPYVVDRAGPTFASISITPAAVTSGTPVSLTVTGATDGTGGVGVAGGEWWIRAGAGTGGQNIPAGTGNAFAAGAGTTSGIAVATTGLAAGNYTVRVRMRDALGNWSGGNNGVRITALRVN
jgi:hypothetical protein